MLCTPQPPPALEADARRVEIPLEPTASDEDGQTVFARTVAGHLAGLLRASVRRMVVVNNPVDRRRCPQLSVYDLTVGEHRVAITSYETREPLIRGPVPAWAVVADDVAVPFERPNTFEAVEWQLARAVWIAVTDREIAAERAAAEVDRGHRPGDRR